MSPLTNKKKRIRDPTEDENRVKSMKAIGAFSAETRRTAWTEVGVWHNLSAMPVSSRNADRSGVG